MFTKMESQSNLCNPSFPEVNRIEVLMEESMFKHLHLTGGDSLLREIALTAKTLCVLDEEPLARSQVSLPDGGIENFEIRSGLNSGTATLWIRLAQD